jgi:chemotaxis protein MotA
MDYATIIGLSSVLVLVLGALTAGTRGDIGAFFSLPALLLVFGGAVAAGLTAFGLRRLRGLREMLRQAFVEPTQTCEGTVAELVRLADVARRDGLLAVEQRLARDDDRCIARAIRMVIDGYDRGAIETVLFDELEATDARHASNRQFLEFLGRGAPAFGMIGTLIGLIIMLRGVEDPTRIGPGMAVALLTTLYGLILAHAVFLPLARKLAQRTADELLVRTIVIKGVLAIQAGDNPRVVEEKLRAFLPNSAGRVMPAASVRPSSRARAPKAAVPRSAAA